MPSPNLPTPQAMIKRKTKARKGVSGLLSSGEWIRTTDLRVMKDLPDFGAFLP